MADVGELRALIAERMELVSETRQRELRAWEIREYCVWAGRVLGGRPAEERRCTKRLGTRRCWNWRVKGTDRCHLHQRGLSPGEAS
jgi:hypothetical protein